MVSFHVSKEDAALIADIVARALPRLHRAGASTTMQELSMDITAVHDNGMPLRLFELAVAHDFDFMHDVAGIHANIDRRTGHLRNCFVPRCAR